MQFEFIVMFLYGLFGKAHLDYFNLSDYYTSLVWITVVIDVNSHFGMIQKQYGKTERDCFWARFQLAAEFISVL
jgi:hypothetical protein